MTKLPGILNLTVGSENTIQLHLYDERDQYEDLTGASAMEFAIVEEIGGNDIIRVNSGITAVGGIVSVPLSPSDAAALKPGRYLGTFSLMLDKPYICDPVIVDIQEAA